MNNKYRGYRFPPQIISRAVWYYHRFQLSFRDIEDLLAERGIIVSYEAYSAVVCKIRSRLCEQAPQTSRQARRHVVHG